MVENPRGGIHAFLTKSEGGTLFWLLCKQWPLAPNSREWRITRANVARRVTFFSKTAVGECWRVWRVIAKRLGECREFGESTQHGLANVGESGESVQHGLGECRRVWRVRATRLGECRRVWRVRATRLGECWRVWRVRAKRFGECRRVWRVLAKRLGECGEFGESRVFLKTAVLASTRTRQKRRIFGEYSNSPNLPASSHCLL